jgi:hypothetical protein
VIKHIRDLFRARRARVPLAAGQISSYRTCPHEQPSLAILERIEQDRDGSAIIHLRLIQLSVKNAVGKVVATEILKTHSKPIEFSYIVSLASQVEKWALSK